jgi:hypothetical protein
MNWSVAAAVEAVVLCDAVYFAAVGDFGGAVVVFRKASLDWNFDVASEAVLIAREGIVVGAGMPVDGETGFVAVKIDAEITTGCVKAIGVNWAVVTNVETLVDVVASFKVFRNFETGIAVALVVAGEVDAAAVDTYVFLISFAATTVCNARAMVRVGDVVHVVIGLTEVACKSFGAAGVVASVGSTVFPFVLVDTHRTTGSHHDC